MGSWCRRWVACWLAVLCIGLPARVGGIAEYEVKAAFLLNFVRLVAWPPSAFPDAEIPYTLGVLADDPFDGALEAVLEGARVDGRPLRAKRIDGPQQAGSCHLVFVPASQTRRLPALRRALAGSPVLVVAEGEGLARRGAAISFYREEGRIRFEVNREAARRVSLEPSSRLLRLARLVEGP